MKKDYIIFAPEYSGSAGVRVLYKLGEEIKKRGYNVYMYSVPDNNSLYNYITEISSEQRKNAVVIYPEVILGNPLQCQNVVRWILYYPGKNGGSEFFDNNEMIFSYLPAFCPNSEILYISILNKNLFYPDKNIPKDINCYFVHKGGKWKEIEEFQDMIEINMDYPKTREELADLLRRTKTLYSYDSETLLLEEAILCGCEVKVVKNDGFEDYKPFEIMSETEVQNLLDNFISLTQKMDYKGKIHKRKIPINKIFKNCMYNLKSNYFRYIKKDIVRAQKIKIKAELKLARNF